MVKEKHMPKDNNSRSDVVALTRMSFMMMAPLVIGFCFMAVPETAQAGATIFGGANAQLCANAAHRVSIDAMPEPASIQACDTALGEEQLSRRDEAATFVNRGVLRLAGGAFVEAKQDFDAAADLMPELGDAYTDRGAALIGLRQYADGIAAIDKGLALNPDEPEKAYYNRALAHEALDDAKAAYGDYLRAAALKPDWNPPKVELARFTVATR